MENIILAQINRKFDIMIGLLLEQRKRAGELSDEDNAAYLASFDLKPSEMAPLLSKSPNAVRILLSSEGRRDRPGVVA